MVKPKIFTDSIGKPYKTAPLGRRVLAFVIDSILISFIGMLFLRFFKGILQSNSVTGDVHHNEYELLENLMVDEFFIFFIIGLPYHLIFEQSAWLASPGKRLLGMIVVDGDAERPSFWQSLLRNLLKLMILTFIPFLIWRFLHIFPPLVFVIWISIILMAANDKYNRFLSDFPTKSFVLQRKWL